MDSLNVYKALCDEQRMRILSLLEEGPLCVCHLMEIVEADQVKMSKQLKYMRELGLVEAEREANWMLYRLARPVHPVLAANLACLRKLKKPEGQGLRADAQARREVLARLACADSRAPGPVRTQALACC